MSILYMLIDRTSLETTSVLKVAPIKEIIAWSKLFAAEGRTLIGPPLEGRGFAKLTAEELQYLYWNLVQQPPPENYPEMIELCLTAVQQIAPDKTPIKQLEAQVLHLEAQAIALENPDKPVPRAVSDPASRPKEGSATGKVWAIADELSFGTAMATRKAVVDLCVRKGINAATASTQYGKWKGSRKYLTLNPA